MYLPAHFEETRVEVLHDLLRARPLGALVTLSSAGLNADHVPFEIDANPAPLGRLRGHVAKANPLWRDFSPQLEALIIFQGAQAYVSPSWYPSKALTGEVVPTYNYLVVHGYGELKIINDREWLRDLVTRLTDRLEDGRGDRWRVADAPPSFIEKQLAAIVGIEIKLTRLVGKWKVSQNRSMDDRAGVARGLAERDDADSAAIARWVKEKSQR
jgi:transcriptional regulator